MFMKQEILGAMIAAAGTAALIGLALYVLLVIAQWKIFTKAGEKGWKSLIPIYNVYTQFKFTWNTKAFWQIILFSVVSGLLSGLSSGFSDQPLLMLILGLVSLALMIVVMVMSIQALHKLSKSFGHGAGYTLGLIFLPNIFMLILGFGSDQYLGPQ